MRATTPPPSAEAEEQALFPATPSTPGPVHDGLPRTIIPPSPGGPRLQALAAGARRSTRLRAPPASVKRSQTAGVRKAAPKKPKTKVTVFETQATVTNGESQTSFMDLPGGLLPFCMPLNGVSR